VTRGASKRQQEASETFVAVYTLRALIPAVGASGGL